MKTKQLQASSFRGHVWFGGLVLGLAAAVVYFCHNFVVVTPLSGITVMTSPMLKELVHSPCFQRLKKIDQSGPAHYFGRIPKFSRASHSLGVWLLLKQHRASVAEQAAGLLHDVSHTAFSHLGDYLFAKDIQQAVGAGFQDSIHISYLKEQHIEDILKRYGLTLNAADPDNSQYKALEQPLPDLCADRIEYNLQTALVVHLMKPREVRGILADLHFDGQNWFFTDPQRARKFADLSLHFTQHFWAAPWNIRINAHFADVLKRGLALGVLTREDLFLTDADVLEKVRKLSEDPVVKILVEQCKNIDQDLPEQPYLTQWVRPKFRGVDPLVKTASGLRRLTQIDSDYNSRYVAVQAWCSKGYELRILDVKVISEKR